MFQLGPQVRQPAVHQGTEHGAGQGVRDILRYVQPVRGTLSILLEGARQDQDVGGESLDHLLEAVGGYGAERLRTLGARQVAQRENRLAPILGEGQRSVSAQKGGILRNGLPGGGADGFVGDGHGVSSAVVFEGRQGVVQRLIEQPGEGRVCWIGKVRRVRYGVEVGGEDGTEGGQQAVFGGSGLG
jgi:hypothetical protein